MTNTVAFESAQFLQYPLQQGLPTLGRNSSFQGSTMAGKPTPRVPTSAALVKHLTLHLKRHLLDNGVEPRVLNEEVVKAALLEFNANQAAARAT